MFLISYTYRKCLAIHNIICSFMASKFYNNLIITDNTTPCCIHSICCSIFVIGAGSVITRDIPANVVAAGAPCRVIREITEADKSDYFNVLETLYDGGK